ncbi:tRNA dihydrouridine synthase DusB [Candidatus Woesearchaeota archaeon]|nr:tRNA dihydrouridine synthase DusB [Candidatus Woesearchaeota archaeon]
MEPLSIGKVKIETPVILAPMAAVNCASFRLLCREAGAGMVTTPMLVCNQVVANPEKIISRTCYLKEEKPISTQLLGSDRKLMEEATRIIDEFSDVIDINLGCPEKDALAIQAGAFFAKHPEQIEKAIAPVISATNKPVTAKIRTGWDEKSIKTLEIVRILEDLGIDAITIHARTKKQKYSGKADWDEIMKAKEQANVPIIGNGDIFVPGTAKAMMEQTRCDAIMVGRGAIGNPLIFRGIKALLETGQGLPEPTEQEKIDSFMRFLKYYKKHEKVRAFTELRQQAMWFTKGLRGARSLRDKLMRSQTVDEILSIYSNT